MVYETPDPDWYLDNVLVWSEPGAGHRQIRRPAREWQHWWTEQYAGTDPIVRAARDGGLVLTTADCAGLGITRSRMRNDVRRRRWTSAGYGSIAPIDVREPDSDTPAPEIATRDAELLERRRTHALHSCGAVRRRPGAAITGRSSAIAHGLPTMAIPATPEITERDVGRDRRVAAHVYSADLPPAETTLWFGNAIETVERTLVTLARHGRRDAIMAADAALREELVDRDDIARALTTAAGWPWVRRARAVLALADPLAESPLESITRLALHDAGFPEPELQVVFGGDRVDFHWRKYGLVLEADGAGKYTGQAWVREKRRERRLLRYPDVRRIERVLWSDIVQTWPATRAGLAIHFR